jgi:hypothetical protein
MNILYNWVFYSSGTVTATGDSGIIVSPGRITSVPHPTKDRTGLLGAGQYGAGTDNVVVPLYFTLEGSDMTVDEENAVTIVWYADSAGSFVIGTTTFATLLWTDMLAPIEYWPGDLTNWNAADAYRPPWIPLPAYCKVTHTLVGAAKSMSYSILMTALVM